MTHWERAMAACLAAIRPTPSGDVMDDIELGALWLDIHGENLGPAENRMTHITWHATQARQLAHRRSTMSPRWDFGRAA